MQSISILKVNAYTTECKRVTSTQRKTTEGNFKKLHTYVLYSKGDEAGSGVRQQINLLQRSWLHKGKLRRIISAACVARRWQQKQKAALPRGLQQKSHNAYVCVCVYEYGQNAKGNQIKFYLLIQQQLLKL